MCWGVMPETFVPLSAWLQPPSACATPLEEETLPEQDASLQSPQDLFSRVRRLRAAVLETLDEPQIERESLERIRRFADALLPEDEW
jgi:hypothetical protein